MLDSAGSYDPAPNVVFNKSIDNRIFNSTGSNFGVSLAANNSHLVVGAYMKDSGNDQSVGAVYLFNLEGDSDTREILPGSTIGDGRTHYYGATSAANNIIVASAPFDDVYNYYEGSVFIFHNDSEHNRLIPPETEPAIQFGKSVSMGNGRIAASTDDSNGQVLLFDYEGSNIAKIQGRNANQSNPSFGQGTLGQGNGIVIGNGRIAIGDQGSSREDGAVHLYDLNANLIKILDDPTTDNEGRFGRVLAIGNNRLLVGEPYHDDSTSDVGVGGTNLTSSGRAHLYDLNGNLIKRIRPPQLGYGHRFGFEVTIGNNVLAIGSPGDSAGYVFLYDLSGNKIQDIPSPDNNIAYGNTLANYGFGANVHIHRDKLYTSHLQAGTASQGKVYVYDFPSTQTHLLDLLNDF